MELQRLIERIEEIRVEREEIEPECLTDDKPLSLVHRRKPRDIWYWRSKPKTAYRPTDPQIRSRIAFGEKGMEVKGEKMEKKEGLPLAARKISELKGERYGRTARPRKWEKILAIMMNHGRKGKSSD